ncbi:uncharacterized protein EI97DRAFT_207425 [Westerdykella ornata]|uniref:Uncharacterized protein n=1 Tax=Westerdykella ornata TaxID=318751 RepID=A0A6A6J7W1_WESOR|nr:uncharacterized protein EI97DRAFT_207425 [Westerdykella ornata]KAF2272492.1 hypothetical protein EI97DRAFT_207425 [Westerdykella ornata]
MYSAQQRERAGDGITLGRCTLSVHKNGRRHAAPGSRWRRCLIGRPVMEGKGEAKQSQSLPLGSLPGGCETATEPPEARQLSQLQWHLISESKRRIAVSRVVAASCRRLGSPAMSGRRTARVFLHPKNLLVNHHTHEEHLREVSRGSLSRRVHE